ncbi:MAG: hypothetical protein AAB778_00445 [Patescibacteria group bacterium]
MNKYKKAVISAVAAGSLLLNGFLPVFASTILITGNGSSSENEVEVDLTRTTSVTQTNNANVTNNVSATSSTGSNEAEDNTGGDVSIDTGDAETDVSVTNTLNQNAASVDCCGANDFDVEISGNGADSENEVELDLNHKRGDDPTAVLVNQSNNAGVDNIVDAKAKTGKNEAEDNTGGNVSIETGSATTSVTLGTTANANSARIGGSGSEGGSLSAVITGNGSDSDNEIELDLTNEMWLVQGNNADVLNDVDADALTGKNEAEDNTGGDTTIETGDAETTVAVDNAVNFNFADADCGCLLEDLLAKISGNGSDSENEIEADLESELGVTQDNGTKDGGLDNLVDANAKTGRNEAEDNTGDPGSDPSIETGDATTTVELDNSGNSNVFGAVPAWDFPESGFDFHFSFDLSDLLGWLGGL